MTLDDAFEDAGFDFRITVDDCRRAGHCPAGIRRWFERHGFDFRAVLKAGVSARAFVATGDGYAARIAEQAWGRRNG